MPISHETLWWDTLFNLPLPPDFGKKAIRGRKATNRRLEPGEKEVKTKKTGRHVKIQKMRRQQVTITRGRCREKGHNSAKCDKPPVQDISEAPPNHSNVVDGPQQQVNLIIDEPQHHSDTVDKISDDSRKGTKSAQPPKERGRPKKVSSEQGSINNPRKRSKEAKNVIAPPRVNTMNLVDEHEEVELPNPTQQSQDYLPRFSTSSSRPHHV